MVENYCLLSGEKSGQQERWQSVHRAVIESGYRRWEDSTELSRTHKDLHIHLKQTKSNS